MWCAYWLLDNNKRSGLEWTMSFGADVRSAASCQSWFTP